MLMKKFIMIVLMAVSAPAVIHAEFKLEPVPGDMASLMRGGYAQVSKKRMVNLRNEPEYKSKPAYGFAYFMRERIPFVVFSSKGKKEYDSAIMDLNKNKGTILARIEPLVPRDVDFGHMELTILSGLGVEIQDLSVSENPAFSQGDFLKLERLQVRLQVLPLLRKQIRAKKIPNIWLVRNKSKDGFIKVGSWYKVKEEARAHIKRAIKNVVFKYSPETEMVPIGIRTDIQEIDEVVETKGNSRRCS